MQDEIAIQKNVLDLEHSEIVTEGITKLGIALTGSITVFTSLDDIDKNVAFILALIFFAAFLINGLECLKQCKDIRDNIKNLLEK